MCWLVFFCLLPLCTATTPPNLGPSYMDYPRITFSGYFTFPAPTINNRPFNYNNSLVDNYYSYSLLQTTAPDTYVPDILFPTWGAEGTSAFRLVENTAKLVESSSPGATCKSSAPQLTYTLTLVSNDGLPPARGVDLDTMHQFTEIWGMTVGLYLQYTFQPSPRVAPIHLSGWVLRGAKYVQSAFHQVSIIPNFGPYLSLSCAGALWQSVVDLGPAVWVNQTLDDIRKLNNSAFDSLLDTIDSWKTNSPDSLSIRMNVHNYNEFTACTNFSWGLSDIVVGPGPKGIRGISKHTVLEQDKWAATQVTATASIISDQGQAVQAVPAKTKFVVAAVDPTECIFGCRMNGKKTATVFDNICYCSTEPAKPVASTDACNEGSSLVYSFDGDDLGCHEFNVKKFRKQKTATTCAQTCGSAEYTVSDGTQCWCSVPTGEKGHAPKPGKIFKTNKCPLPLAAGSAIYAKVVDGNLVMDFSNVVRYRVNPQATKWCDFDVYDIGEVVITGEGIPRTVFNYHKEDVLPVYSGMLVIPAAPDQTIKLSSIRVAVGNDCVLTPWAAQAVPLQASNSYRMVQNDKTDFKFVLVGADGNVKPNSKVTVKQIPTSGVRGNIPWATANNFLAPGKGISLNNKTYPVTAVGIEVITDNNGVGSFRIQADDILTEVRVLEDSEAQCKANCGERSKELTENCEAQNKECIMHNKAQCVQNCLKDEKDESCQSNCETRIPQCDKTNVVCNQQVNSQTKSCTQHCHKIWEHVSNPKQTIITYNRYPRCTVWPDQPIHGENRLFNPRSCLTNQLYQFEILYEDTPVLQDNLWIANFGNVPTLPVMGNSSVQPTEQWNPHQTMWWDVEPVLDMYELMFPIMTENVGRIGSYDWVVQHRTMLRYAFENSRKYGLNEQAYMPVTRDMSPHEIYRLEDWLSTVGRPTKGRPKEWADRMARYGYDQLYEETKRVLQCALQLELATIPPYLTAAWSIKKGSNTKARATILEVAREEMLHMTLAANIMLGINIRPRLDSFGALPTYPGPLPCGVRPELIVPLGPYSPEQAFDVFMEIEEPGADYPNMMFTPKGYQDVNTIGDFYDYGLHLLEKLDAKATETGRRLWNCKAEAGKETIYYPPNNPRRQLNTKQKWFGDFLIPTCDLEAARGSIAIIKAEGEGAFMGNTVPKTLVDDETPDQWMKNNFPNGCPITVKSSACALNGVYEVFGRDSQGLPQYRWISNTTVPFYERANEIQQTARNEEDQPLPTGAGSCSLPPQPYPPIIEHHPYKVLYFRGFDQRWVFADVTLRHTTRRCDPVPYLIENVAMLGYLDSDGVAPEYSGPTPLLQSRGKWKIANATTMEATEAQDSSTIHYQHDRPMTISNACEPAHYFKFEELWKGRELVETLNGTWDFVGNPIPFDASGIYNMKPNTKMADLDPDSDAYRAMLSFNKGWSQTLYSIQQAFDGLSTLDDAIGTMWSLQIKANELLQTKLKGSEQSPTPSWEAIPIPGFLPEFPQAPSPVCPPPQPQDPSQWEAAQAAKERKERAKENCKN